MIICNRKTQFAILAIVLFVIIIYFLSNTTKNVDTESFFLRTENQSWLQIDYNKIINFHHEIFAHEKKIYSQYGEDGIIQYLIGFIKISKTNGYFVEFGTQDASECNTRNLRDHFNWSGLLMDGSKNLFPKLGYGCELYIIL